MRVRSTSGKRIFKRIRKVGRKSMDTIDRVVEVADKVEKYREMMAEKPMSYIASEAVKLAAGKKNPIGATGLSLMPPAAREQSENDGAVGGITTSYSMYMYRPPRKRMEGIVNYQQKTFANGRYTTTNDVQKIIDIDILDAEPVLSNPDSNTKYSNLTVRKAFDNLLLSRTRRDSDGTAFDLKEDQTSIHFKSLEVELVLTNNLTSNAMVDVYEMVPQHDLGPSTYVSQERATGYMSPSWTYETGLATDVVELEDGINYNQVQSNPFNSVNFSRTWKIVKRLRLNMSGNSTHRHKSVYQINKTISYQKMAQVSTAGGKFEGWNPTFMVVQKGAPIGGVYAGATDIYYTSNMQLNYSASAQEQARVIVFDDKQ